MTTRNDLRQIRRELEKKRGPRGLNDLGRRLREARERREREGPRPQKSWEELQAVLSSNDPNSIESRLARARLRRLGADLSQKAGT